MDDNYQAPIDPPDEPSLRCKGCGGDFADLRRCVRCGLLDCEECMQEHLLTYHGGWVRQYLLDTLTDIVGPPTAADRKADRADAQYHDEKEEPDVDPA